ncbi:MAG: GNAT family N-acetyltransferase [bacterium]
MEFERGQFRITDSAEAVDIRFMTRALNTTYWAGSRTIETVRKSAKNSVILTLLDGDRPIGFTRIVGDYATFAWVCDVYLLPEYRGDGLGTWLVECTVKHPANDVPLSTLATRDAFGLYEKSGYAIYDRVMVRRRKKS